MDIPRILYSKKANNKTKTKTPLRNKQRYYYNIPKKLGSTKSKKKSPKTIDYSKLMEKYGNMIDSSFTTSQNTNKPNNLKHNKQRKMIYDNNSAFKTISPSINGYQCLDITDDTNYSPDKFIAQNDSSKYISSYVTKKRRHHKSSIDINHYQIKKNYNVVVDRYSDSSNNNNYKENNGKEIEKLNKQIQDLKTENNKLKLNTIGANNNKEHNLKDNINKNNIIEKIFLLLNLCRKYAKKFNKFYPLFELNFKNQTELNENNNNDEILQELKNTIIQYNNMVFNKKISNLFQIAQKNEEDFTNNNDDILNPLDISEFEPNSINFSEKYKTLAKNLQKENSEMKNKLYAYDKKIENFKKEKLEYEKKIKII